MAIVAILLINMLIAMMGNTYQKIAETKNEWQRQVKSLRLFSLTLTAMIKRVHLCYLVSSQIARTIEPAYTNNMKLVT